MTMPPSYKRKEYKKKIAASPRQFDLFKWFASAISILGIQAWIAGAAFEAGYWANLGLDGPFIAKSLQQMALQGFLGPFKVWGYAAFLSVGVGFLLLVMAINTQKIDKPEPQWVINFRRKVQAKFKFDKELGLLGLKMILGGYAFLFFVVIPLILWALCAYYSGKDMFEAEVCKLRSEKLITTKIGLKDGTIVAGRIIDRSENLFAINDGASFYVFNNGDNPSLAYSIALSKIECPNK